mmetsp:Transcript_8028/g.25135  ORF Transcript_8028/g.25135 Transcript_8028/m.25135 type:complete len:226 (+) Transcript_8028:1270-1947(+)
MEAVAVDDNLLDALEMRQRFRRSAVFLENVGPVQLELRVFVRPRLPLLAVEGLPVRVDDLDRRRPEAREVVRERVRDPVHLVVGFLGEELVARLEEAALVPELDLEQAQVSQDLDVVRVDFERLLVRLDRLLVVSIAPVQQAVDVPADVRPHVRPQPFLHEGVGLLLPVETVQHEAAHRERLAVVRRLLQDLVRGLQALLVLLRLVELDDVLEDLGFFLRELLRR